MVVDGKEPGDKTDEVDELFTGVGSGQGEERPCNWFETSEQTVIGVQKYFYLLNLFS